MKFSRAKKSIILFLIGLLFVILDVNVNTGISFPNKYSNSSSAIGEFQYYNIKSAYGADCTYKLLENDGDNNYAGYNGAKIIDKVHIGKIRIDIFNDFIGYILIAIAAFLMIKCRKEFKFSFICAIISFFIHGIIRVLPFAINGMFLCNIVMMLSIAYIGCGIMASFLYTSGSLKLAHDICCRDERKWIKMTWFVFIVLQIMSAFVFWVGSDMKALITVGHVLVFVAIIALLVFYLIITRICDYIQKGYDEAISKK